MHRIGALGIPPAWKDVWISPDPLGHQARASTAGVDQCRYHRVWREQRDARSSGTCCGSPVHCPGFQSAVVADLGGRPRPASVTALRSGPNRSRPVRIGRNAPRLDHTTGRPPAEHDVTVMRGRLAFHYTSPRKANARTITPPDPRSVNRTRAAGGRPTPVLVQAGRWRPALAPGEHLYLRYPCMFFGERFRTWNAARRMALLWRARTCAERGVAEGVTPPSGVADWLSDTRPVARAIDPQVMERHLGRAAGRHPRLPALLPARPRLRSPSPRYWPATLSDPDIHGGTIPAVSSPRWGQPGLGGCTSARTRVMMARSSSGGAPRST
jgi:hypothetical protein